MKRISTQGLTMLGNLLSSCSPPALRKARVFAFYDCVFHGCTEVVGFAAGQCISGEMQVMEVGVHPDMQRRGIGKMLMQSLLQSCPGTAVLEVRS